MHLTLIYAARFYSTGDGTFVQPAYGKYVEALAAHVDELTLCGPLSPRVVTGSGFRLTAPNIKVVGLPYFERDIDGLRLLPRCAPGLRRALSGSDLASVMLPLGLLGPMAFGMIRAMGIRCFLHVVGDLSEQWDPEHYPGIRGHLARGGMAMIEAVQESMIRRSLTFAQGKALMEKHGKPGVRLVEAMETTINDIDIAPAPREWCGVRPPRLLYAGNLIRPKGVHVLLDALALLHARGVRATLTVAGAGPEAPSLQRQAEAAGLSGSVELVGFRNLESVWELMDEADLFVFPSFGEGMPRVILEAMARGLPVVSTEVGGIAGVIEKGRNGWLVPPGRSEELAEAIRGAMDDPVAWRRASEMGIETARGHTMDHYARLMVREIRSAGLWAS